MGWPTSQLISGDLAQNTRPDVFPLPGPGLYGLPWLPSSGIIPKFSVEGAVTQDGCFGEEQAQRLNKATALFRSENLSPKIQGRRSCALGILGKIRKETICGCAWKPWRLPYLFITHRRFCRTSKTRESGCYAGDTWTPLQQQQPYEQPYKIMHTIRWSLGGSTLFELSVNRQKLGLEQFGSRLGRPKSYKRMPSPDERGSWFRTGIHINETLGDLDQTVDSCQVFYALYTQYSLTKLGTVAATECWWIKRAQAGACLHMLDCFVIKYRGKYMTLKRKKERKKFYFVADLESLD